MLNVSGHLLSTMEVEAALVDHPCIAETAVVAHPHPVKGECLYCFIVLKDVRNYTLINYNTLALPWLEYNARLMAWISPPMRCVSAIRGSLLIWR